MPSPVCTVGSKFEGICYACDGNYVQGEMISGSPDRCIEGKEICVTGSVGMGYCGHMCHAVGGSSVFFIDSLPVARVGDAVEGDIVGHLIEGSDFVNSD